MADNVSSGSGFVHLHVHSYYSILDGMNRISDIVSRVKSMGMKACAITDHGVGYGLVEFYDECKKQGIKPILGCEMYEAPEDRMKKELQEGERYYHIILLVKNETGYQNLCHLISQSNISGMYYKPRIDFSLLKEYHEGLICLSACVQGRIARYVLKDRYAEAEEWALKYKALFGDDYFLEIQDHGLPDEQKAYAGIIRIAKANDIPLVCTNDSHYVDLEDAEAHDYLICLQHQKQITDPGRVGYVGNYSLRSEEEMRSLYPDIPEAYDNTVKIADRCSFDFVYGHYRMPKVYVPGKYHNDYFGYLSDLAEAGFEKRYPEGNPERLQAQKNLSHELSVIRQMNFAEYFLDTRKTINWCKENRILVGPGRGSAAGSTLCYCLGITDIDPIPYGLIFERFLNPERVSMPDIDCDYDYSHKDDVVKFEADSNGWDHFSKIQTFVAMNAKGVLKDVARVSGYPVSVGVKLASCVPDDPKITLDAAYEMSPELREMADGEYAKLWQIAKKLEGVPKSVSTHACGHIPTPVPCEDLYPVSVDEKTGYLVCQYNMTQAEHLGNLKKDLLMLRNLTIIDSAIKGVKARFGVSVPLWSQEILNDKEALQMIARGDTDGVFQLESDGMKGFMRNLKPDCFEDIIAGVALYRPGPMDFIPDYIKGKHDPSSIHYLVPQLEPILAPTYGQIVYQEQVMAITRALAGFSMAEADLVRKAMGKKKMDIMMAEKEKFIHGYHENGVDIPGCIANGISEQDAETIYGQMVDFAKYAFNKSHAACYAAISMETAYLKAHYPVEFAAGLLTSVMDKTEKLAAYTAEFRKKGIHILNPDINSSEVSFSVSGSDILYGLASIKNAGTDIVKQIVDERKRHGDYESMSDFVKRNPGANKRTIESFIKAGAFDFLKKTRRSMLAGFGQIVDSVQNDARTNIPGQMSIFDLFSNDKESMEMFGSDHFPDLPEMDDMEMLRMEKQAAGFYLTAHPVEKFTGFLSRRNVLTSKAFTPDEDGNIHVRDKQNVTVAGLVTDCRTVFTKKDNRPMAFITLEDPYGTISAVAFPGTFEENSELLVNDAILIINGRVNIRDGSLSVVGEQFGDLTKEGMDLCVRFSSYGEMQKSMPYFQNVQMDEGFQNVFGFVRDADGKMKYYILRSNVKILNNIAEALKNTYGEENVVFW